MKSILFIGLLLVVGGYYYVGGGRELLDQYLNPAELPETIDTDSATFLGDHQRNPYAQ